MSVALVTGSAGFIGFHLSRALLNSGFNVVGIDSLNEYYDVKLKLDRNKILSSYENYSFHQADIATENVVEDIFNCHRPEYVYHLAAQAGVRYSIEKPREYIRSNIAGSLEVLEAARKFIPKHLLLASTSSIYGLNPFKPYKESSQTDYQVSLYASTKKSMESMSFCYSHLYSIPTTIFRFFTVYGPWGRPDMAPHKFTQSIIDNQEIEVYNFGKMKRDFTFIDDLIEAIYLLRNCVPKNCQLNFSYEKEHVFSNVPWRAVNIGNSDAIQLTRFISSIEKATGFTANKKYVPMQPGDVKETLADNKLLFELTGFTPSTTIEDGIYKYVEWYRSYYK